MQQSFTIKTTLKLCKLVKISQSYSATFFEITHVVLLQSW